MSLLTMAGIYRSFPGVVALDGVDLQIEAGEVHALLGENGAGKSTLMKVLGGVIPPERGVMTLRDRPYAPRTPHDAQRLRIGFIHQELNLASHLSVAENIFLGRFPQYGWSGIVNQRALRQQARALGDELGLKVDVDTPVGELNIGQRQLVEIARAMSFEADILIMDEPTAALSEGESQHLFGVIRRWREQQKAIIYISHRMDEVFSLADRITVLRDGSTVGTFPAADKTADEVIRLMVGRDVAPHSPGPQVPSGAELLRVEGLSRAGRLHDISLTVRAGEIVGLAGLVGAGRTEIARAIVGADPVDSGTVWLEGIEYRGRSPRNSVARHLAYLPEDRKSQGLFLHRSVEENINIAGLPPLLRIRTLRSTARHQVEKLKVRPKSLNQHAVTLSGGNQQKVLLGRWLARGVHVMILDEPTRGVDIGARAEMYRIILDLAVRRVGVLLISSDLAELLMLCDTVLVVRDGRVSGRFSRAEATPDAVMACALS